MICVVSPLIQRVSIKRLLSNHPCRWVRWRQTWSSGCDGTDLIQQLRAENIHATTASAQSANSVKIICFSMVVPLVITIPRRFQNFNGKTQIDENKMPPEKHIMMPTNLRKQESNAQHWKQVQKNKIELDGKHCFASKDGLHLSRIRYVQVRARVVTTFALSGQNQRVNCYYLDELFKMISGRLLRQLSPSVWRNCKALYKWGLSLFTPWLFSRWNSCCSARLCYLWLRPSYRPLAA